MICYNCGNEITTQGTNCPFCGSPLSAAAGNQPNYNQTNYNQNQQGFNQNGNNQYGYQPQQSYSMSPSAAAVVCYITLIGFIIALICADKNHPLFKNHLNNASAIIIASLINSLICAIPFVGWIVGFVASIFLFICWLMGLISAANGEMRELPVIGQIKIFQ